MQHKSNVFGPVIALCAAMSLMAGGFALQLGKPSTNPEAQAKNAVLVVRGYACVAPEKTTVSATAEGIVNGKHRSIPLKLVQLSGESICSHPTVAHGRQVGHHVGGSEPALWFAA